MTFHYDVWRPSQIPTLSGARCTRMIWISVIHHKNEVCSVFQGFYQMVTCQCRCKIQVIQSDNGGGFANSDFSVFCPKGIHHQTTCINNRQQNGLAERNNLQLLEVARASLFGINVPRE